MRKTNEEFAAEVFRRSAEYRQERTQRIRAAGSITAVLCLAVLGGALYSRQNLPETTSGVDGVSVCEEPSCAGIEEAVESADMPDTDGDLSVQGTKIFGQHTSGIQSFPESDGGSVLTSGTETPGLLITGCRAESRQLTLTLQNVSETEIRFQPTDLVIICSQNGSVREYPYTGEAAAQTVRPQETLSITVQCKELDGLGETFQAGVQYRVEIGSSVQKFQINIQRSQGG